MNSIWRAGLLLVVTELTSVERLFPEGIKKRVLELMPTHPAMPAYKAGARGAIRVTDCITQRQFRETPQYRETLLPVGLRYQTVVTIDIPGKIAGMTVIRARDFTDKEAILLHVASQRFWLALYARDCTAAKQILEKNPDEDLRVGEQVKVTIPRGCGEIWLAAKEGKHPTMESGSGAARDQLAQRVEARPDEAELLSVLGVVDAYLGRKEEAILEATRAVGIRPVSEDAVEGPWILENLAVVYAWTNEPDLAFRELSSLVATPAGLDNRETFKADPTWDPIRKDPRFDQLAAQLPQRP
jgi:hypothetical protein